MWNCYLLLGRVVAPTGTEATEPGVVGGVCVEPLRVCGHTGTLRRVCAPVSNDDPVRHRFPTYSTTVYIIERDVDYTGSVRHPAAATAFSSRMSAGIAGGPRRPSGVSHHSESQTLWFCLTHKCHQCGHHMLGGRPPVPSLWKDHTTGVGNRRSMHGQHARSIQGNRRAPDFNDTSDGGKLARFTMAIPVPRISNVRSAPKCVNDAAGVIL